MTPHEHHMLCLGLLADLYHKDYMRVNCSDLLAIEEAIESAEQIGLPVSVKRLIDVQPIFKSERN